jgi:hypothetical protein
MLDRSKLVLSTGAIVSGVFAALLSGLFEQTQGGMLGAKNFGYPWIWRSNIVQSSTQNILRFDNLAADIAFWSIIIFILFLLAERFALKRPNSLLSNKRFVYSAALLMPMGLLIGLIHELGHALAGTALGGTLSYLQLGFVELYPKLTIASQFKLGSVIVTGLPSPTQQGLLLIAGSLSSTIAALTIGVLLYTRKMDYRSTYYLKIIGILGLLDLPLYATFSSMGLRHWILFGETQPEPLIGARQMGIPDPIFYLAVAAITFALILLYSKKSRTLTLKWLEITKKNNHKMEVNKNGN